MKIFNPNWKQEDEMLSMFKIRRFIHVSCSKNRDWKPVISQILTNGQENLSCHVNANCTNTIGSHVCTCHTGYTGDGQTCSSDFDNFSSSSEKSFITEERQPPLLLFLYIQSQLLKAGGNLKRLFSSNYKTGSNQTFILKFIPH